MKKYIFILLVSVIVAACGTTEDPLPSNVVKNSEGLNIDLEWSTGGSSSQSMEDVDLDLYLEKDGKVIDESTYIQFEQVSILDHYADGEYEVKVKFYDGTKRADYSLFVNGFDSNENILFTSYFLASDEGTTLTYLKIIKEGDEYTILDL
ncbi:hypothetical protein [Fulvivirga ligni]|uniref:hypothetical protein n=1 Tax=Fulvivirga ligni TaxID=2904246 RepID=UPI001F446066|nr:hypothetical protein [Fulvivirga ligni]UII23724.1 hypothetical protein LVD16_10855 [Fulvivirga ligni]